MIKPLGKRENHSNYVVLDIENIVGGEDEGKVIHVCFAYRVNEKIEYADFSCWETAWEWLIEQANSDSMFRQIWAHNGGGWDYVSLVDFLLQKGLVKESNVQCAVAGSKIITLSIKLESYFIVFCDSLQVLRSSLDKLAKTILGEGKIADERLPHEILLQDREKFILYCHKDCELLLRILERCADILRELLGQNVLSVTIGSTAMRAFRSLLKTEISIPWQAEFKETLRKGYRGGRVEVLQYGEHNGINVYDVNSLYPYAMRHARLPISDRYSTMGYDGESPGIYRITFRQSDHTYLGIFCIGGHSKYEGEGWFYTPEIKLAIDNGVDVNILEGYTFTDSGNPFVSFVDTFYGWRLQDKNGPIGLLCKYILNSLYGKFAQKSEKTSLIVVRNFPDDLQDMEGKLTPLDNELRLWRYTTEMECKHEHVGIAGTITSYARVVLWQGIKAAIDNGGKVCYCDTDSVHVVGSLPDSMVSTTELGKWKLEYTGNGIYAGKKLYCLYNGEDFKVRAKGIHLGKNAQTHLNPDSFRSIINGESIECIYNQPTTVREVFSGKRACKWLRRKRTIRKT